jgi:alkylation response protein AidB-like acyl-CoA dehydrogenase
MDFNLTEDQLAYQEAARDFAANELAPHATEWDQKKHFPKDVLARAVRDDVGGSGLSRLDGVVIFEELAAGCTSTTAYLTIHNMVTWMVDQFAKDEVRKKYCPELCAGRMWGSYCLTEPNSGSDAASLVTSAKRTEKGYVLNGAKAFVSGGGETDVLVVMARTGEAGPKGISAFVVPTTTPGITYGENEKKMGWNTQPTRIINFDSVEIPAENLLGEEGEGFKIAMKGLDGGRINIASCSIGAAQSALSHAQRYMHERKQFGKELAQFQALQFRMADMAIQLVAARQMIYNAASRLDAKDPNATTYCAMAKCFATDAGFEVCNQALQIFGGYGYTQEYPLERHLRDTRVHQILEGTNEVMRMIVSRKILDEGGPQAIR